MPVQSYNSNCCFWDVLLFHIYIYSKRLVLFILCLALDVTLFGRHTIEGPEAGLAGISGLFNISDAMQSFRRDKSSSISPLAEGKSKNLQKYFNETKGSLSKSSLLAGVPPIAFVSDSKD